MSNTRIGSLERILLRGLPGKRAMELWKMSPGHRANMLGENYTQMGVGRAEGMLDGEMTIFFVQVFGKPRGTNLEPIAEQPLEEQPAEEKEVQDVPDTIVEEQKILVEETRTSESQETTVSSDEKEPELVIEETDEVEETLEEIQVATSKPENPRGPIGTNEFTGYLAVYSSLLLILALILKKVPF